MGLSIRRTRIPSDKVTFNFILNGDFFVIQCERRTPQQASGGSPTLGSHNNMLAMDVTKEARASPLPASAQQATPAATQQSSQPQVGYLLFTMRTSNL